MLNIVDFTHGGCIAYLVDMSVSALLTLDSSDPTITSCTSIPAVALEVYHGREPKLATVSQSLVVHFLGPSKACVSLLVVILSEVNASACSGDQLRLVSTTVVVGGRVRTLYCEARRSNPLVYLAHTYRSYTTMSPPHLFRRVPPGLTLIGSLFLDWKLVSLPANSLGSLQTKPLADDLDLPCRPSHFDCRGSVPKEPPLCEETEGTWRGAPSTHFLASRSEDWTCSKVSDGNITLVTSVIVISGRERPCRGMNKKRFLGELVSNWGEQIRIYNVRHDLLGAPRTWDNSVHIDVSLLRSLQIFTSEPEHIKVGSERQLNLIHAQPTMV
jgi:hypothetical protein